MKRRTSLIATIGAGLLALAACDSKPAIDTSGPGDEIVQFEKQNAAMNAAIAEARTTLPRFLARLDAGESIPSDNLKVGFPIEGDSHEHIWVREIARKGDELTGVLDNEPNYMPGLHEGSPVTFSADLVSDWSYTKNDKRWGNYTTRVMLPYLEPEQAAAIRESLSDTPTESNAR